MYIENRNNSVAIIFRALKKPENLGLSVDIVFAGCYIYHDRRSTTVIATADVATTVVIKYGRR